MSETGARVARVALEKLLQKAERAWARQGDRTCTLPFSDASFPEYLSLPSRGDKDVVHAEMRNAERDGAVTVEWDRRAGTDGQILRIVLVDADNVAKILCRAPAWQAFDNAERELRLWADSPQVKAIFSKWRNGKPVRGLEPERVREFVDACKVIDACHQLPPNEEMPIRRLSAALFSDSKRIEALGKALDALTIDSLDVPGRDIEDVLSALGLVKHPMPILIAGQGAVELVDGQVIPIPTPYIGLAPQSIKSISFGGDDFYVLTVENLTTFHELALGKGGPLRGIVLYTAGMPSPALLRVYRLLVSNSGQDRFHWGDIDLGGFRIAVAFARAAIQPLKLWAMDPSAFPSATARKVLSGEERQEVIRIGAQWGWSDLTQRVVADGRAIEQEALPLTLPDIGSQAT